MTSTADQLDMWAHAACSSSSALPSLCARGGRVIVAGLAEDDHAVVSTSTQRRVRACGPEVSGSAPTGAS